MDEGHGLKDQDQMGKNIETVIIWKKLYIVIVCKDFDIISSVFMFS